MHTLSRMPEDSNLAKGALITALSPADAPTKNGASPRRFRS
jgi:hypothetical protein